MRVGGWAVREIDGFRVRAHVEVEHPAGVLYIENWGREIAIYPRIAPHSPA